jgi:hypothetical protein
MDHKETCYGRANCIEVTQNGYQLWTSAGMKNELLQV